MSDAATRPGGVAGGGTPRPLHRAPSLRVAWRHTTRILVGTSLLAACTPAEDAPTFHADGSDSSADTASGADTGQGPCPVGMALAGATCIDIVEAVLTGDLGDANQGFDWPDGSTTALAEPRPGELPTLHVSWYQADAACRNAGKHLCTVEEWVTACSTSGSIYPWGDAGDATTRCALVEEDGTAHHDTLQPAGSLADCVSPEGVFDMIGNAWEWADPGGEVNGRPATAKLGGAYYAGHGAGRCDATPFTDHLPDFEGTIAVRCCVAPAGG